jgi:hypothetical protein
LFGFIGTGIGQLAQSGAQRFQPEIIRAFAPVDAIQKRGEVDQLGASLGEIKIGDKRTIHGID